ncbi:hypothetical protein BDC45DRAFT_523299 [Circinella umbellata]|nr:hypothetical protein BDC45DRAFT_523299 [Circinella umbellata]
MLLDGPGAYAMVELGNMNLPRSPSDTPLLPSLIERFCQLKNFAEDNIKKLYEAHRRRRHSSNTDNYQKQWLRQTCQAPIIQEVESKKKRKRRS